jgi:hypothetical protein
MIETEGKSVNSWNGLELGKLLHHHQAIFLLGVKRLEVGTLQEIAGESIDHHNIQFMGVDYI